VLKINSQRQAFSLTSSPIQSPIILVGPPTYNGTNPGVVRLRGLTGDAVEARFQEWEYRQRDFGDTVHTNEHASYLLMSEGRHTMADGSTWEVGAFGLDGTGVWSSVAFDQPFDARPFLFLTVQTDNDDEAVTVRQQCRCNRFRCGLAGGGISHGRRPWQRDDRSATSPSAIPTWCRRCLGSAAR
jgi:hypothetical protein